MYFPIFIDLSDKEILVVGAGKIASRRVGTLCRFAGHITVLAPEISQEIRNMAEQYPVTVKEQRFEADALEHKDLVLAATDDLELNRRIVSLCREKQIPVNACSEKELCDFYFPSVLEEDGVVIGLNASGKDHGLVKRTRQKLEDFLKK